MGPADAHRFFMDLYFTIILGKWFQGSFHHKGDLFYTNFNQAWVYKKYIFTFH